MAISRRPIRPLALIIAIMFLLAPLAPLVGAGPGGDGPGPGDDPLGPGDGEFTADEGDDVIPIVTLMEGPDNDPFAASVTNLGDVDGDGVDDMIVGSGYNYWLEKEPFAPWGSRQYLLLGEQDERPPRTPIEEAHRGRRGIARGQLEA